MKGMEGAYGCVFRPAVCNKNKGTGMVSKAFDRLENLNDEYESHQRLNLKSIPNYKNYYITDPEKCQLDEPVICKNISTSLVLNYPDGGRTLKNILEQEHDPTWVLKGLSNIFYGVMLMNGSHRYHLDIKPDNIVLDDMGQFRLIDFGFSKNLNISSPSNLAYDHPYEYWPFEMGTLNNFNGVITNKYLKGYLSILYDEFVTLRKREIVLHTDIFPLEISAEMIYNKADVWGLGLTLCKVYEALKKTSPIRTALLECIKKLLIFNPLERPNGMEAYAIYTNLIH